jgi:hypothetical protein
MSTSTTDQAAELRAAREARRRERVAAIQAGGLVHQQLGQTATYHRLDDGQHVVSIGGRTFTSDTLAAAIDQAKGGD